MMSNLCAIIYTKSVLLSDEETPVPTTTTLLIVSLKNCCLTTRRMMIAARLNDHPDTIAILFWLNEQSYQGSKIVLTLEDPATVMKGGYNYATASAILPKLTRKFIHLK